MAAVLKQPTVFRAGPTYAQLNKLNHGGKSTMLSSVKGAESLGTRLSVVGVSVQVWRVPVSV